MEINEIMALLPHRYPFLLVDRVSEMEPGQRAVGWKNVTINEPFFAGHFPGRPVMPGVLIVEALAQVGAVALLSVPEFQGKLPLFAGLDGVRFRRQVVPGDELRLEVEIVRRQGRVGKARGVGYVGEDVAAEGEITFVISDM